ncbi:hypothetical protein UT300012_21330 [Paraclostridium bifermentans]
MIKRGLAIILGSIVISGGLVFANSYDPNTWSRTIDFQGIQYKVKDSGNDVMGPNANNWSDSEDNVNIDAKGNLNLNLVNRNNKWYASEVVVPLDMGYGRYEFRVIGNMDKIDSNVMASMFLYSNDNQEIDIEFSDFKPDSEISQEGNMQFVMQPYYKAGNLNRFRFKQGGSYTSYVIDFREKAVKFEAYHGHDTSNKKNLIREWTYTGKDIPSPEGLKLRANIYIRGKSEPKTDSTLGFKFKRIKFTPQS